MANPTVDKPEIPAEYGDPKQRLDWSEVEERLRSATAYWIASTRPDGRPHVVPRDGIWIDGALYYGGSSQTVHSRNIMANPNVVVHIGDGLEAIIAEGAVEIEKPTQEFAERLVDEQFAKYPQYGRQDTSLFMGGVAALRPKRVLAWTNFMENATRFRFE
jgi:pyridoxamine 5'-phosphate oxidase-like protein